MISKPAIYRLIFITLLIMAVNSLASGQNQLTISSTAMVSLDFKVVYRAGQPSRFLIDDSKWLNYTVIVGPNDPSYSISVQIVSGSVPDGVDIKLKAGKYNGTSQGRPGSPRGEISLSHIPQVLIDNIGTSYTGAGPMVGHRLTYYVDIKDFERLQAEGTSISLLFTLSQ